MPSVTDVTGLAGRHSKSAIDRWFLVTTETTPFQAVSDQRPRHHDESSRLFQLQPLECLKACGGSPQSSSFIHSFIHSPQTFSLRPSTTYLGTTATRPLHPPSNANCQATTEAPINPDTQLTLRPASGAYVRPSCRQLFQDTTAPQPRPQHRTMASSGDAAANPRSESPTRSPRSASISLQAAATMNAGLQHEPTRSKSPECVRRVRPLSLTVHRIL